MITMADEDEGIDTLSSTVLENMEASEQRKKAKKRLKEQERSLGRGILWKLSRPFRKIKNWLWLKYLKIKLWIKSHSS